jgi:hypothetical protein
VFKGYSADMRAGKFPLVSIGGRADTSSVRSRGARTPIGVNGNSKIGINRLRQSQDIISIISKLIPKKFSFF